MNFFTNLLGALVTRHMLFWALEHAAKRTDTLVDDHAVALIKAGVNNDREGIEKAAQGLINAAIMEYERRVNNGG